MDNFRGGPAIRLTVRAMTDWDVPGYDTDELLGFGTSGEVWRARERSSGTVVALRRLAGGDRDAVAAVKRSATIVRSLPSEHVVRLRTTTRAGRDDVLVLDHAPGGSLAALLARRGPLLPGEVVTAVAPIAEALGQAHANGLVHGRVRAASVLLTADGKPLLDGLGLACLHDADDSLDPTGGLGAAADVWAVGALAHLLLTGSEPGTGPDTEPLAATAPLPLMRAIQAALGFDPTRRPSASDLASSLLASCPATPLSGVVAASVRHPSPPSRFSMPRRVPGRAVVGAATVVVLLAMVTVGWAWGASTGPQAARVRAASSARIASAGAVDWRGILQELDTARAVAFARAQAAQLARVYALTSPLLAADSRVLSGLNRLGRTARGVEHLVRSLTPLRTAADRAELEVVEALAPYVVADAAGRVLERRAAGPVATHVLVLVRTAAGWRIGDIHARP